MRNYNQRDINKELEEVEAKLDMWKNRALHQNSVANKLEAERDALIENNNLKADAIDRWINTSAEQQQEIEELQAKITQAVTDLERVMLHGGAVARTIGAIRAQLTS